jgi:hypothetical protein
MAAMKRPTTSQLELVKDESLPELQLASRRNDDIVIP